MKKKSCILETTDIEGNEVKVDIYNPKLFKALMKRCSMVADENT